MNKTSSTELENKIEELTILRNMKSSKLTEINDDLNLESKIEEAEIKKMKSRTPLSQVEEAEQLSFEIKGLDRAIGKLKRKLFENEIINLNTIDIHDSNADLLNYQMQASILSKKAINAQNGSHLAIMGPWGSGKSFLIKLIKEELLDSCVSIISVNASSGGNDETIWNNVLLNVSNYCCPNPYEQISNSRNFWKKIGIFFELLMVSTCNKFNFFLGSLLSKGNSFGIFITVFLLIVFSIFPLVIKNFELTKTIFAFLPAIIISLIPLLKSIFSITKELFFMNKQLFTKYTYPNYKESLGAAEEIKTELIVFRDLILKKDNTKKLIITIDELDRCSKEDLIKFFKAIENFIALDNITFIFSINPRILVTNSNNEEQILDPTYLDKYFKIPYIIPQNKEFTAFICGKCKYWFKDNTEFKNTINLINEIAEYKEITPRDLNKLFNLISIYYSYFRFLSLYELTQIFIFNYFYSYEILHHYDFDSFNSSIVFKDFNKISKSLSKSSSKSSIDNLIVKSELDENAKIPTSIKSQFYENNENLNLDTLFLAIKQINELILL